MLVHSHKVVLMSICSVCKNPERENILEAPTLPFRTWVFLSPARCKSKYRFARHFNLSVTAGTDHYRSRHLSVPPGYYAILIGRKVKVVSLRMQYPYLGYWGMLFLSSSQCFVSLCLSIGSHLV